MDKINFENLPSTNTPINSENLNQMQDNIENAIKGTILWENPDPSNPNGFEPQTVTLNDSVGNYDTMVVVFRTYHGSNYKCSTGLLPIDQCILYAAANTIIRRLLTAISGTSATFGEGQIYNTYDEAPTANNIYCIPERIIGYKHLN